MLLDHVVVLVCDFALQLLDALVVELRDSPGLETDHVVVMRSIGELEHGLAAFEVVPTHEPRPLELRQHAIDGRQTELFATIEQRPIDAFGRHVALPAMLENLEHLQARRRHFEAGFTKILSFHVPLAWNYSGMMPIRIMTQTDLSLHSGVSRASMTLRVSLIFAALLLAGCVYRIDIQQGNLLNDDDVVQVEVGMSRSQVQFLLGTPMVADSFHRDRWDYAYYLRRGRSREVEQRWLVVYFDSDRVSKVERDVTLQPAS